MSGNATEGNNSFDDYYKTDNFDDSELQARLYAEIYYESNIEGESGTTDVSRTVQSNSMATEMSIESESMQRKPEDEQPSVSEAAGGKPSKIKKKSKMLIEQYNQNIPEDSSTRELSICNNVLYIQNSTDSQRMHSTDQIEFAQVDTLANREMNPAAHECDMNVNENPKDPSEVQGKGSKESSSKKHKSSKYAKSKHQESTEKDHNTSLNDEAYSKYNVVSKSVKQKRLLAEQISKDKHALDSSDSEESIFEVPVPSKPTPPLINLQDSDEEGDTYVGMDNDPILKKWAGSTKIKTYSRINSSRNPELEFTKTSNTHQDIFSKSRNTDRSSCNKDIPVNSNKNIQTSTRTREVREDIVLNCTTIQRGARNISEIKQLFKSAVTDQDSKSTEDTNQNFMRRSPQDKIKGNNENNVNLQQETSVISPGRKLQTRMQQNVDKNNVKYHIYNCRHINHETLETENRKRQHNNEVDSHSKQKRQCTDQQSNQDIMPQGSSSGERRNEFLRLIPEHMRNYYNNSTRGQENFDVRELQRGMSKDPRKWAILDEDLMPCPPSRQRSRFWNVRCNNCHRDGHQRYDCPTPRRPPCCYMCGVKGHTEFRCPQKMCLTCGKQQSTFRKTCEYCRVLYCTMCNSAGHEKKQCPDLWRRYHQTTDMSNTPRYRDNIIKPPNLLHCCNCTKRGHESSTCREYRWSQHFPTPATVTNYIDGPAYMPRASSSSGPDPETGFLSPKSTGNKTSFLQSANNMQQATSEDLEPSTNVDMLSSNTSQGVACTSRMEENLQFSPMVDNIWPQEKTAFRHTKVNDVSFMTIIYSCGTFRNKNNKDARMILKSLSSFLSKKPMLSSTISHEVTPIFLKTLLEKTIEFEVKIGYTASQPQTVTLQLLAMKEYIEYLYDLLKHWFSLPDDEKSYGMDVTLPMNPTKMFNLLSSRAPQLEKMHFTCYAEHIGGLNDPRWIHNFIKNEKAKLKQHKGTAKQYNRLRTKLWRLQIKLLMIVNTEPKPNTFVRAFRNVMAKLETERSQMGDKFNIATYLRLTLLYNTLFVPHTPSNLQCTLRRVDFEVRKNNKNNCPLQTRQGPETATCEQGNLVYNVYSSSESAPSCTPQIINPENPSAINNQQNNEILVEGQNRNDIVPETSETTDRNYDNETMIRDFPTHDSQIVVPLYTEPVSAQSEDPGRDKDQLSISEMNTEPNLLANKQNVNVNDTVHLTKKQKKRLKNLNVNSLTNINDMALNLIHQARSFKLPHMMSAADEMQRQINNQSIKSNHVQTLAKLIQLQKKYQRNVNIYCRSLKM